MKKIIYLFVLSVIMTLLNYGNAYSQTQISINQMPSSFFANWYSTDGNDGWAFGITKDHFRTNNIFYNYDGFYKSRDGVYTIKISHGAEYRTYYVKDIGSNYMKIAGINGQFTLFKSSENLPNIKISDSQRKWITEHQITVNQMPSSFFVNWYSTDGNNGWAYGITKDNFRTNNIFYNYDGIYKSDDDIYTIKISHGTEYRTYYVKDIGSNYMKIAGSNGQFTLFKSNKNLSDNEQIASNHSSKKKKKQKPEEYIVGGGHPCPGTSTVTDSDGNVYNTVQIGSQCWMRENLKVGTCINVSQEMSDNGIIEKYCPDGTDYYNIYGGLYQWSEMMQYTTTEGTQGICPDGWHIPTDAEWNVLIDFLGGDNVAKHKMVESGTAHWYGNYGATNSSGFTALPCGSSSSGSGWGVASFENFGSIGSWWSSSEASEGQALYRSIVYYNNQVYRHYSYEAAGRSVRCLKD